MPPAPLHPHIYSNGHICLGTIAVFFWGFLCFNDLIVLQNLCYVQLLEYCGLGLGFPIKFNHVAALMVLSSLMKIKSTMWLTE